MIRSTRRSDSTNSVSPSVVRSTSSSRSTPRSSTPNATSNAVSNAVSRGVSGAVSRVVGTSRSAAMQKSLSTAADNSPVMHTPLHWRTVKLVLTHELWIKRRQTEFLSDLGGSGHKWVGQPLSTPGSSHPGQRQSLSTKPFTNRVGDSRSIRMQECAQNGRTAQPLDTPLPAAASPGRNTRAGRANRSTCAAWTCSPRMAERSGGPDDAPGG